MMIFYWHNNDGNTYRPRNPPSTFTVGPILNVLHAGPRVGNASTTICTRPENTAYWRPFDAGNGDRVERRKHGIVRFCVGFEW